MAPDNLALAVLFLIVLQMILCSTVGAQNTNFSFPYFTSADVDKLFLTDDVQLFMANSSFLLNSRGASLSTKSCGRLVYRDKVRMKDASGAVASFTTSFTFQITGLKYWRTDDGWVFGDGLAFAFTRNSNFTDESTGASLCLMREENNGMASNRLFAVEFDTFQNDMYNDTSNNHIGVDINNMASAWSYNLCGGRLRNCTYLCNGGYFTAWIDYDGGSQKLQVFLSNGSSYNNVQKPAKPLIDASLPAPLLAGVVEDYMYVGFSASTGFVSAVHHIQSWSFASFGIPDAVILVPPPANPNPNSATGRKVGIIAGAIVGVIILALCFCVGIYRRRSPKRRDKFSLVDQNLVPRAFTCRELSKATKNFSRSELLGSGGFGAVYRGTLPSGALVAVKRMRHESKHGEESFQAEAASLSQIRHRNLVQLRGWCQEEEQLFLVYDYMCNGSLDERLYHKKLDESPFPLALRHSVLSGVAAALSYLHEDCAQCVLHRDIKSSNVLLDGDLNAYLGDFGLARLIDHRKMEKTTMMAGTLGYMAPEMPHTGKATKESDVYSFGVLALEVMCGARPLDMTLIDRGEGILVDRVWRAHEAANILQIADSRLHILTQHGPDVELVANLLRLGLLCCDPNPEDRPPTRLVAQLLQSRENMEMSMPPVPVCRPHARYSRPGFSQTLAMMPPSSSSAADTSSGVREVPDAGLGSESQSSSLISSGGDWNGEPVNMQTSFVASSEIFSGR